MATQKTSVYNKKTDEKILVVPRADLFPEKTIQGFARLDVDHYQELIEEKKQFLWRSKMEVDPTYKQIIPYLVFTHDNKYFLMQRSGKASEARLQNKYSLGIGGHIRQDDMTLLRQGFEGQEGSIMDWARREFAEEINYDGSFEVEALGLLNDERDSVGQVHTGFVFLLKGDSDAISVKSELAHGKLATLQECLQAYDAMESWSKMVFDYLKSVVK